MRPRIQWLLLISQFLVCSNLRGTALTAADDQVSALPNTPTLISVLKNDLVVSSNQTAILRVSQPLHGKVVINSGSVSNALLNQFFQFAAVQLSNTVIQVANTNLYPWTTASNGTWNTEPPSDNAWITGFFPGLMWFVYEHTGDTNYRNWAQNWMTGILPLQYSTNTDDVGFMINTSYGNGYRLTGNPAYKAVMLQAAQSFSNRFNNYVGCLADDHLLDTSANPPPFEVIMDTMMNSELLYRAYDLGGSSNLFTYAITHAGRTLTNQLRPDGSTFHTVIYNFTNGTVLFQGNRVAIPALDTWARGHAWAIHGFTMAYQESGDARFLSAAERAADFYINNVPADYVPYWYFQTNGLPPSPPLRDSSAAAITLSATSQLAQMATNSTDGARYWQAAINIFNSLSSTNYLAQGTSSSGILLHGNSVDSATDSSLIYGDYYFLETLKRLTDLYGQTTLTYIPNTNYSGADSFTYQACDSSGATSIATVSITVGPLVPNPSVAISTNGFRIISFSTAIGTSYFVQYSVSLNNPVFWNSLATNIAGTGSTFLLTDSNTASRRFYRLGALF